MKSPLARARGLGSAHEGVHHWLHQRITAIALVPLMIWLVVSIVSLNDADYGIFTGWIAQPVNATLLIFVIIAGFYHAALGLQVVLEDYISCKATRIASIITNKLFFLGAGLASVFSILKIAL
jgi:succinate dehydrogenase / fumarate reductase membrane anchor subunit